VSFTCHIDIESFSTTNLPKTGVYRYSEDPLTEILCIAFAFGDKPPSIWIPDDFLPRDLKLRIAKYMLSIKGGCYIGWKVPRSLSWHADNGGEFRAHNSQFERVMLNGAPGHKIRFPKTKRSQWVCTAAKAAVLALPRKLEKLCCDTALDTPHKKDLNGKGDMMRITQPRTPSKNNLSIRWTPDNAPDKFYNMYTYCVDDVFTERDCDRAMIELTAENRKIFLLDQIINDRGWKVDLDRVADVQHLITRYKAKLKKKCREITGLNPTQTQKFAIWIRDEGVEIENLQAQTIKDALKRPDLPQNARWALRIRSLHEMKAPTKYTAMERAVCTDGALHGMFLFNAASTGRWSSLIVQLQNLFRPIIDDPETAIEAFRLRSISWIKFLYDKNPMKIFASCVRGMLIPRKGRDILAADFNAIEAVIVAWLSDSKDLLKIFATHGLAYEYTASKMFGYATDLKSLKTFKKAHPKLRFLGKIAVLALGYQGGGAAFVKMAKDHGTNIKYQQGERIKWDWRSANPKIVQMWEDINEAAIGAVEHPGVTFKTNKLMFRVVGDYLCMRLPSKRKLYYYKPFVSGGELRFWGINTHTRQWCVCSTYGGKLLQNAAEGIARDLMTAAMLKIHKKKIYPILGTCHDELITEPKEGVGSLKELVDIMCNIPSWAAGMPVKADGFRSKRYRK
jgi:DNA polymerase